MLMPVIGFGTAGLQNKHEAIEHALKSGYLMFDTASDTGPWYRTEAILGELLQNEKYKDIFIITKVHPQDLGKKATEKSIQRSLSNLKRKIDLLLIHYPECWSAICSERVEGTWEDAWKVMEEHVRKGDVKALGVSNFNLGQLERLLEVASIKPSVVQDRFDPLSQNDLILGFCLANNLQFMEYSALGTQWVARTNNNPILIHDKIQNVAMNKGKSPAQVILRWLLHKHIVVIPRSNNLAHIEENLDLFNWYLTPDQLSSLDFLGEIVSK